MNEKKFSGVSLSIGTLVRSYQANVHEMINHGAIYFHNEWSPQCTVTDPQTGNGRLAMEIGSNLWIELKFTAELR